MDFSLKGLLKLFYNAPPPPPVEEKDPRQLADQFNRLARGTYENGLETEIKYEPAEVIYMRADVKSGSNSDPAGRDGCAHFTEHMSFCANAQTQAMLREFRSLGGNFNATTMNDQTVYEFVVPRTEYNENLLYRLSSRVLFNDDIDPAQFEHEREILSTEMEEKIDISRNDPAITLTSGSFGLDVPYFVENGGTPESLGAMTLQDVLDYRRKHYVASNMKVVVTGVPPATILENLRTYFASQPAVPRPDKSGDRTARYVGGYQHIDSPGARQTYVGVAFPYPEKGDELPRAVYAQRQMIEEYISLALQDRLRGAGDRRVYHTIVGQNHFRDQALMAILTNARPDRADAILPAAAEIMAGLAAGRVDAELFNTAKAQSGRLLSELNEANIYNPHGTQNPVDRHNLYQTDRQALENMTPADLTVLAREMLAHAPGMVTMGNTAHVQSYDQFVSMLNTAPADPQQAPVPVVT